MDTANRSSSFSGPWTNEKHLHYLNAMEAAFVHTMLDNKRRLPRLDRYLPDTSDSTLDLNTHPTKKQATTSRSSAGNRTGMDSRADKRLTRRRRSNRPYTSSEDQTYIYRWSRRLKSRRGYKDESDPPSASTCEMR